MTDRNKFIERTQKRREEEVEALAYKSLATFLSENINFYDVHYVSSRLLQSVEEGLKKVDFSDPKILKLRKELLKRTIAQLKDNLPALETKDKPDDTDYRNIKCEPVVHKVLDMILDEELLLGDQDYLNEGLPDDDRFFLHSLIRGYLDPLYSKLIIVLAEHEKRCNKYLWGVDREKITFQMLNDIIKKLEKQEGKK